MSDKRRRAYGFSADFSGTLLDVPIGTALYTIDTYRALPHAQITGLDYSQTMLEGAKNGLPMLDYVMSVLFKAMFAVWIFQIILLTLFLR
ncbi:MAG: class I SAM-dependent methyltransferase [Actinomycetaceae bacterium]|nr:class I SAM-dependent methyltransferase [Actinomycetaceae bacterium]